MMKKASQREEDNIYVFPNTCVGRTKQWYYLDIIIMIIMIMIMMIIAIMIMMIPFCRWWYLFEYPSLSKRARVCALISFFFVLVRSTLSFSTLNSATDKTNHLHQHQTFIVAALHSGFGCLDIARGLQQK